MSDSSPLPSPSEKKRFDMPSIRLAAALFALALLLFLVGNASHSLWDRDETRYAEATREMCASGDWIVPRLNGEIRYDKPILIYWLMSLGVRLNGVNAYSVRIPSALAGAITTLLVFVLARRMSARNKGAGMAALAACTSGLLFLISKAATTDAVLTLTVVAAMAFHWESRTRAFSWLRHVGFWSALALSALVKGPPGVAVVGLAVATDRIWETFASRKMRHDRSNAWKRALRAVGRSTIGLGVFLAIGLPWAILVWRATNGDFLRVAVGHHVVERSQRAFEGHSGPIVYYLALLPALLLPMTAAALNAMRWAWKQRRDRANRFLWSWFLPGLLMFSIVRTKLPHYMAPLLPAVCLMIGRWWDARGAGPVPKWWKIGAGLMGLFGIAALAGIPTAFFTSDAPRASAPWIIAVAATLGTTLIAGATYWWRHRAERAMAIWITGTLAAYMLMASGLLPSMEPWRPAPAIGGWLRDNAPRDARLLAETCDEASLLFYSGMQMEEVAKDEGDETIRLLSGTEPVALVVRKKRWESWIAEYDHEIPQWVTVRFTGRTYLYRRGKWRDVLIVGNW